MGLDAQTVLRAWKDPEYRDGLPADVRAQVPPPPADLAKLDDEQLAQAAGGATPAAAVAIGGGAAAIGGALTVYDRLTDDPDGPG